MNRPCVYIVMGVSGSGKSTVGSLLARRLDLPFYDADDYHSQESVAKMASGQPLQDADRWPWLDQIISRMKTWIETGGAVLACSALKSSYRERLRSARVNSQFIFLDGTIDLIRDRLQSRNDHFMPMELLRSQFETLEPPKNAIYININDEVEALVNQILFLLAFNRFHDIGVIGLGAMGKGLATNLAGKQYSVAVYNRRDGDEKDWVDDFIKESAHRDRSITGYYNIQDFMESLVRPRKIILMIKAGGAVDQVLADLLPFLEAGDTIMDCGNSHYRDTQRRQSLLKEDDIDLIGIGISGGAKGARYGASIMPGGDFEAFKRIEPVLGSIAAKDQNDLPCMSYLGEAGAGHFVKMVHNGIEYAEMQLLAELYHLLQNGDSNEEIADILESWLNAEQSSYLLQITMKILRSQENGRYVLDSILDEAESKGTGSWSSMAALELGSPVPLIDAAVAARLISKMRTERQQYSKQVNHIKTRRLPLLVNSMKMAYGAARILNHHLGFQLLAQAYQDNNWTLDRSEIARIWTKGCIIRSDLMEQCQQIFKTSDSLLNHGPTFDYLKNSESHLVDLVRWAAEVRIPIPCFSAALNFWLSLTSDDLPANLIQAQRDFFGAHGYKLRDDPDGESVNNLWEP